MFFKQLEKKNYYFSFSFYFLLFGIAIALIIAFINYTFNFTQIEKEIHLQITSAMQTKEAYLKNYISKYYNILSSIIDNDVTKAYLKSPNDQNKQTLNNLFLALTNANTSIMQLRYIDSSGQEIIRIDRDVDSNKVIKVSQDKLQDKSQRYYFKEASKIEPNEFWHSNIDLNIENEKIEFPLKPTYRIAKQLLIDGKFEGIVIVNILCKDLLKTLAYSEIFDIYLVDKDGHIIKAPNNTNEWGKYLENKKNIYDIFPQYATKILQNKVFDEKYTFSHSLEKIFLNKEDIRIILHTKENVLKDFKDQIIFSTLVIAIIIIIISSPLAWLMSIAPTKLQATLIKAYEKMRENTEIIDKYVIMFSIDKAGVFTYVSKKFDLVSGYHHNEIIGKHITLLNHPLTPANLYEDMLNTLETGQTWEGETIHFNKYKHEFWLDLIVTPEFNEINEMEGYTAIAKNITNQKIIERISITDELTQIYNRRKIEDILKQEIDRAKRYKSIFSVIFLDIDKFKTINDLYGHSSGDDVLVQLAATLKKNLRETDFVGRWGGEEFIIVCAGTQKAGAFNLAQTLRSLIESTTFPIDSRVTISLGVAQYEGSESISDLISRVDTALYQAKELGRNRVEMA